MTAKEKQGEASRRPYEQGQDMEKLAALGDVQTLVTLFILIIFAEIGKQAVIFAFNKIRGQTKQDELPAAYQIELRKIYESLTGMNTRLDAIQNQQIDCRERLPERFVGKEIARTLFDKTDRLESELSFMKGQRNGSANPIVRLKR
ncbi:MAG: hypothetical protein JEZ02_21600 [Desulfatibacillum sp.]|nr:hypothetical protein [Desulfatibacillum sp.]